MAYQLKTPLHPGESVVRQGQATLRREWELVGGHLYLTTQRLIFEPHRVNFQKGTVTIDLGTVAGVRKAWTKFLVLPLVPNLIIVTTSGGEAHEITCYGRAEWIAAIDKARSLSP